MNVNKCANGHFFDTDKYPVCPHCGAGLEMPAPPAEPKPAEKQHRRLFKKRHPEAAPEAAPIYAPEGPGMQAPQNPPFVPFDQGYGPYGGDRAVYAMQADGVQFASCPYCGKQNRSTAKFCIFCGSALSASAPAGPAPEQHPAFDVPPQPWQEAYIPEEPAPVAPTVLIEPEPVPVAPAPEIDAAAQSLQNAVLESVDEDDNKTIGFYGLRRPENVTGTDPVVGWLVCVKGPHWGESFSIYAGRNTVGRNASNKIVLKKDNTVSREKHAWITFDSRGGQFTIQPGESRGMTYLNGETVFESKPVGRSDKIEFGDGVYILVPLCGEDFSWESYI